MFENEIDQALLDDFFAEYEDAQLDILNTLAQLTGEISDPENDALINNIRRRIHSIKSNLRMIGANQQSDLIHLLESLLTLAASNPAATSKLLLYLIPIVIEDTRFLSSQQLYQQKDISEAIAALHQQLEACSKKEETELDKELSSLLESIQLQGDYDQQFIAKLSDLKESFKSKVDEIKQTSEISSTDTYLSAEDIRAIINNNADLSFFKELIEQLESFYPFWSNRSEKLLILLMNMNRRHEQQPVNEEQLIAAVFMHDIGMGFIPPVITHKSTPLTPDEEIIIQDHIHHGSELLKRIPGWDEAAHMVSEHHESIDGSGYPLGLKGDAICDGAKLLNIGDAYWAMTNDHFHKFKRKAEMHALMDINKKAGIKYDDNWVNIFNEVLKAL